ncbi:hypothetical protein BGC_45280 [Burkholderia sp. 3C]
MAAALHSRHDPRVAIRRHAHGRGGRRARADTQETGNRVTRSRSMKLVEIWQLAGNDGHQADFYLASFELGEATRLPRSMQA